MKTINENTKNEVIRKLITDRENTLSVISIPVMKVKDSLSNPKITVGTLPYYDWSKDKKITFVICYGRYLDCSMLCYESYKKDNSYFVTDNINVAILKVMDILNNL